MNQAFAGSTGLWVMTPEELRYPVGHFTPSRASDSAIRGEQINILRMLPERLRSGVADLNDSQLDTPYRDGGWTVRQVVHHVADSHMNSYVRFKLALTEDWPTIKPYDEAAWANLPDSPGQAIEPSLTLITALHARWVVLLETMSETDYEKGFNHPERGRQNLATALALYAWHSRHHTGHITSLRVRRGW
jgi:uncharacterized damage-inducible protein DinB